MKATDTRPILSFTGSPGQKAVWGFTKYFWLKYVRGFNPAEHCAKSLLGKHSRKVWFQMSLNSMTILDELPPGGYDFIYLCGVSENFIWQNNLHLPVRPVPGAKAVLQAYTGMRCVIQNAEIVEIPQIPLGFAGFSREFTTCRNWQFGVNNYSIKGFDPMGQQAQLFK